MRLGAAGEPEIDAAVAAQAEGDRMAAEQDRFGDVPGDICRGKHPTAWWITCQLEPTTSVSTSVSVPRWKWARLMFSQYTVHWQDPYGARVAHGRRG